MGTSVVLVDNNSSSCSSSSSSSCSINMERRPKNKKGEGGARTLHEELEAEVGTLSKPKAAFQFLFGTCLVIFGVLFGVIGWKNVHPSTASEYSNILTDQLIRIFAVLALILGIGQLIVWILYLFGKTRRMLWNTTRVVRYHVLKVVLLLLSVVYLPVTQNVLSVFMCEERSCPKGTRFPPNHYSRSTATLIDLREEQQGSDNQKYYCLACDWFNNQCSDGLSFSLCASRTTNRLRNNVSIECTREWMFFFWPAAGLIVLCFVFGIPFLFWGLISTSADHLMEDAKKTLNHAELLHDSPQKQATKHKADEEAPLSPRVNASPHHASDSHIWVRIIEWSNNVALTLYSPYKHAFRYWKLIMVVYKLVVVCIIVFVGEVSFLVDKGFIAMAAITALHVAVTVIVGTARPYFNKLSSLLSCIVGLLLAINTTLGMVILGAILTAQQHGTVINILLAINIVVPLLSLIMMALLLRRRRKKNKKKNANKNTAKVAPKPKADQQAPRVHPLPENNLNTSPQHNSEQSDRDSPKNTGQDREDANNSSTTEQQPKNPLVAPNNNKNDDKEPPTSSHEQNEQGEELSPPHSNTTSTTTNSMRLSSVDYSPTGGVPQDKQQPPDKQPTEDPTSSQPPPYDDDDDSGWSETPSSTPSSSSSTSLTDQIRLSDHRINIKTQHVLTVYFMVSGVLSFIAMGCCILGILHAVYSDPLVKARPYVGAASVQLAGYNSWQQFSSSCCCMDDTDELAPLFLTERWLCDNGVEIQRQRRDRVDGELAEGLHMRPFCSKQFVEGCVLVEKDEELNVNCSFAVQDVEQQLW